MSSERPVLFIGSSSEGLKIAHALERLLARICEVIIWDQGVFGLSQGTLESLVSEMYKYDFAVPAL
jgi:predicted nucleotide-binding protein